MGKGKLNMKKNYFYKIISIVSLLLLVSLNTYAQNPTSTPNGNVGPEGVKEIKEEVVSSKYSLYDYLPSYSGQEYIFNLGGSSVIKKAEYIVDNVVQLAEISKKGKYVSFVSYGQDYYEITDPIEAPRIRENSINERPNGYIILQEPLTVGNTWNSGDSTFTIEDIRENEGGTIVVSRDYGSYKEKYYFALDRGLVSIVDEDGNYLLNFVGANKISPEIYKIDLYYPNNKLVSGQIELMTNDSPRKKITEIYKNSLVSGGINVLGGESEIQYLYILDGIVYIDLNEGFINYINNNSQYENEILVSLTNTLCKFYNGRALSITINDQRYESSKQKIEKYEYLLPKN